jgi:hypothetical protein
MRIGIDRRANLAVVPIEPQERADRVEVETVIAEPAAADQAAIEPVTVDRVVAERAAAQALVDLEAIVLWGIGPKETDLHDGRVLLAQRVLAMANDQRVVDDRRALADTDSGPQETVPQVKVVDRIDRAAVVLAMQELHLALKGAQSRLQHAAGCDEQAPFLVTLLDRRKVATGREAAAPARAALEAVAVNVRLALEREAAAEAALEEPAVPAALEDPAAGGLDPVLRVRVRLDQAHRIRVELEAVHQELEVLAQRVQVDLAEVESLAIEVDRRRERTSCADALH